eukprot:CAMPEP_0196664244 /NCGR_PEP_ID=MMETSP1086-20130531/56313_1 /TAXON_ID=77921 /ORGANISM="Cyanoptyche  gloeocystis , Strain SAG4.97" /LENGTH=296 /DNA_ID=CAMNT_0042000467 /DNA_START=72 /DNA_END=962 /DNA_ORIENTATION=-
MNRLFYRPEQCGLSKVAAAKNTLSAINPDVVFSEHNYNITTAENFDNFMKALSTGGVSGTSPVSLVLSCVDNFTARVAINRACLELGLTWMESGVSEDAVSGHIQVLVPGQTACFECAPPLVVATGIDESTLKRDNVCAASLPTTMGIIAGLLSQNTLKYLLGFGTVTPYLAYNALLDFFPSMPLLPNPACTNAHCRACQRQHQENIAKQPPPSAASHHDTPAAPLHADNQWGIVLDKSGVPDDSSGPAAPLADGLRLAYAPARPALADHQAAATSSSTAGADISDLQARLHALQS